MDALPPSAAWRHEQARDGFEVVFTETVGGGVRFTGTSTAVEEEEAWIVEYAIVVDDRWATVSAQITARSRLGRRELELRPQEGRWWLDGAPAAHLDGCHDVDLEASVLTNAFPARRLGLSVGESADAPAAYVRAATLEVQRLEQRYTRLADGGGGPRFDYAAPVFDFRCELAYDGAGLLRDYPGIAVRVA